MAMKKFGTFSGVFVPSFEAILGAVLFLLLPHLVGEMGMVPMLAIVVIANLLTTATAFSIGDCTSSVTNVGSGGMYAVSKRSLGRAFGGSIGIQLFLAQAASIGFYAMGFATPLQELLLGIPAVEEMVRTYGWNPIVQKQILASLLAVLGLLAALVGADFVVKLQFGILIILGISVLGFFFSPLMGLEYQGAALFTPTPNLWGAGTSFTFFVALTTFFPAVTGIDAGVGMSGMLKDPRKSLFRGTFLAIGSTFLIYAGLTVVFSYINPGALIRSPSGQVPSTTLIFQSNTLLYVLLMTGIMVATSSSALSYFVTAPRTAQALVSDDILPRWMNFLKKDFIPRGQEPRVATVLTFLLVLGVIWSGDVDMSARVVGIAFLVVYGWINLVAFFERVSGNPSFRPSHRVPWLVGLSGFVGAMAIIALDNLWIGIGVIFSQLIIFNLILRYKAQGQMEGVWWGLLFNLISFGFSRLKTIIQGTKNWRPMVAVFVFADTKSTTEATLKIAKRIGAFKGMYAVNVFPGKENSEEQAQIPEHSSIIHAPTSELSGLIPVMTQMAMPNGLNFNSVLFAVDTRLNMTAVMEQLLEQGRHLMLYKEGTQEGIKEGESKNRIDLWWKGHENGNFMALLSYIIIQSDDARGKEPPEIRIIRKLWADEPVDTATQEMQDLIDQNNIAGEVFILPADDKPFVENLQEHSRDASLILMGMPGNQSGGWAKMFHLDKMFFERELKKYQNLPPILFVKAAGIVRLMED